MTREEKFDLMAGDEPAGVLTAGENDHTGTSDGIPRLGVPTVYYTDGPLGVRQGRATAMPAPIGLAATFSPALAARYAALVGDEAKKKGNDVIHAPTVNIMRTPLAGRTFEAFGEDPLLTSRIAVSYIRAMERAGVLGNVKHYAANNQEVNRFTVNAVVDERTLREIYLPHFEASVREARVGSVMAAYNSVNAEPMTENRPLLLDVLKGDWGFEGYVLTDYGFAQRSTDRAANNGLDLEMPFRGWYSRMALTLAVESGAVSQATIDEHVRRILRTMFAYGMFDRPAYRNEPAQIDVRGHGAVARDVEQAATVLLRNDGGALPLDASRLRSIALIGEDADRYVTGGGSANVRPFYSVTPREGIGRRAGPRVDVRYDDGEDPERAAQVARSSDVAIVFASDSQTEFADKPCLSLRCGNPDRDQDALIEEVGRANRNTIVVLETGGPVLMPWVDDVRAVVEAWYPGVEGGNALAAVLFGDADPSGRLPASFPRREEDKPASSPEQYPGVAEQAHYSEGVFVGYRHYDERGIEPLFPFGHGLSYTTFGYGGLRIERGRGDTRATVSAAVRNTGRRPGVEVAQLYLGMPDPSRDVQQPPKVLRGFSRVVLAPGGSRRVRFPLDSRAVSYWDAAADAWRVAPGCYEVMVGRSSRDIHLRGVLPVGGARCGRSAVPPTVIRCVARRLRLGASGLGPLRLGQTRGSSLRRAGRPARRSRRVHRYSVCGGGRVIVVFSPRGRARLVASTARAHRTARIRPGDRSSRLRRAYPRLRRLGRGMYAASPSSRLIIGAWRGRVRFVAVVDRPLRRSPGALHAYLRRGGVR